MQACCGGSMCPFMCGCRCCWAWRRVQKTCSNFLVCAVRRSTCRSACGCRCCWALPRAPRHRRPTRRPPTRTCRLRRLRLGQACCRGVEPAAPNGDGDERSLACACERNCDHPQLSARPCRRLCLQPGKGQGHSRVAVLQGASRLTPADAPSVSAHVQGCEDLQVF